MDETQDSGGTIDLAPYTISIEKNSRGFTWNVKVRSKSPIEAELMLKEATACVRQAIADHMNHEIVTE